jgi:hypothetical protein
MKRDSSRNLPLITSVVMNARFGRSNDPDVDILRSGSATEADLRRIAAERPDLHAMLAEHPKAYPDLLQWLSMSSQPVVHDALANREARLRARRRSTQKKWMMGVGGGLALLLVATGAFFAFSAISGPKFDKAPSQSAAVDLDDLGKSAHVSSLPGRPDGSSDVEIFQLIGSRETVIMALEEKTMTPKWMAPVPHSGLSPETADETEAQDEAGEDDEDEGFSLDGTPRDCTWADGALTCGNRTIDLGDGALKISPKGDDSDSDGAETAADDAETDDDGQAVSDPLTEAAGLTVGDDGSLQSPAGKKYPDISLDQDAAVRMVAAGENGPWIVSDGTSVIAVDDDAVLWKQKLSEQAAAAIGLGEPRLRPNWEVVDGVLVIADDKGVHGVEAETGDELWRVDADVSSFAVTGERLAVMDSDGVLDVFDFSDSSRDSTVTADRDFNRDGSGKGAAKFPGANAFKDAKLSIPPGCAEFGLAYDDYFLGDNPKQPQAKHEATFKDGKAAATASQPDAGVEMQRFSTTRLGDQALTLVEFSCFGGGTYTYPSLGLYNADLKLLDSVELWDLEADRGEASDISGYMPKPYFTSANALGQYVSIDVGGIGVIGDDSCTACEKSATADVLYRWNGKELEHQDTVYQVPDGEVRAPDTADVQKFAEAVADGRDDEAKKSATPELMDHLDDELGDDMADNPPTVRSVHFPDGVKVDTCELAQAYDADSYGEYYFLNGRTTSSVSSVEEIRAGDFICGVDVPDIPDDDAYQLYLLLRGTADGSVMVYEAGRQFS